MISLTRNPNEPAGLLAGILLFVLSTASAQSPSSDSAELEEITVTAQMREQSITDVPISISAFGQDELSTKHIVSAQDLAITPGVSGYTGSSFVNSMSVRGISTNDFGVGSEPSIAFYQNGVFLGRTGAALTRYFDMERVEVLRGPQGSLFGRSASAGVLHAVTAKPDTEDTFGYLKVGAGERGLANIEGSVNIPMSDTWAIRVAAFVSEEDGWIDNTFNGQEQLGHDAAGGRATIGYKGDSLTANLVITHEERNQGSNIYAFIDPVTSMPATGDAWTISQDASANFGGERDETSQTFVTLTLDYDLSNSTLTSITGYRTYDFEYAEDYDASEFSLYDYVQFNDGDYLSQEIRLVSNSDGAFDWAIGVSGYWEDLDSNIFMGGSEDHMCGYWLAGDPTVPCPVSFPPVFGTAWPGYTAGGVYVEPGLARADYNGYSVFGDLTYHINDQFEITGGLRYSLDEREFNVNSPGPDSALGMFFMLYTYTSVGEIRGDEDWTDVSPRIVLKYKPNDSTTTYFSASKGYKAGGFDSFGAALGPGVPPFSQVPAGTSPAFYDSEEVLSYEVGLKTQFLDGRLGATIAAYLYDYEDLQFLTQTATGNFIVRNAGQVDGNGIELELDAVLNDYISAYLGIAWSDTEARSVDPGACSESSGSDCNGNKLPNNPDVNAYLSATATIPTGLGDIFVTAEYNYDDDVFSNLANELVMDSRRNVNVRVGIEQDEWRFAVFVENVTGEDFFNEQSGNFLFPFNNGYAPNRPRTFGAEFQYNFGASN
jgi:iron complex outermembrane receptor protein